MTINKKMQNAVDDVPAISDFFYADPDNVLSNVKTGATPLFRLLRSTDNITNAQYTTNYNQNEVLMFTKVMDRTPEGNDEENAENELIQMMLLFMSALRAQGVDYTIGTTPRWGRRQSTNYALGLIVEITINKTFATAKDCVTGYYLPDPLNNQSC